MDLKIDAGSVLHQTLRTIDKLNSVEAINNEDLQELWQEIQELKKERNKAKKLASIAASEPYDNAIEELERQYALFVKLMG